MSACAHRSRPGEGGSATVHAVVLVAVLVVVAMIAGTIAAALVGHRRAAAGADLSALAGASALQRGDAACAAAADLAEANDVRLVRCASQAEVVSVVVATDIVSVLGPGLGWTVTVRARAGPTS